MHVRVSVINGRLTEGQPRWEYCGKVYLRKPVDGIFRLLNAHLRESLRERRNDSCLQVSARKPRVSCLGAEHFRSLHVTVGQSVAAACEKLAAPWPKLAQSTLPLSLSRSLFCCDDLLFDLLALGACGDGRDHILRHIGCFRRASTKCTCRSRDPTACTHTITV